MEFNFNFLSKVALDTYKRETQSKAQHVEHVTSELLSNIECIVSDIINARELGDYDIDNNLYKELLNDVLALANVKNINLNNILNMYIDTNYGTSNIFTEKII